MTITTIRTNDDARTWLAENDINPTIVGDSVRIWAGCRRCGGEGGSRAWLTWTCFDCGGAKTTDVYKLVPLKAYAQKEKAKVNARQRKLDRIAAENAEREEAYNAQLAASPALAEAMTLDHPIVRDMASRKRELSEKQVALAMKLAERKANEPAKVAAPVGPERRRVEGTVLGTKEDWYGNLRMTVKVIEGGGEWLCWGTVPSALLDGEELRGAQVGFDCVLKASKKGDPHFAIISRPTKAARL